MWEKFHTPLPSDDNLKWFLTQERGFTQSGAKEFIKTYKNTMTYAISFGPVKIEAQDSGDEIEDEETDEPKPPSGTKTKKRKMTADGLDVLTIPLLGNQPPILIEGVSQISEENWAQFMAVLNVMKPSLIQAESETPEDDCGF
jgi:hypothetical protein